MPFTGDAAYKHGNVLSVDHTPSGAVAAGDVIVIGEIPFIAHLAIAADAKGAVSANGGVYECTSGGTTITGGDQVFWNVAASKIVDLGTSTTGDKHFGYTVPDQAATSDNDPILVIHDPHRIPAPL